MGGELLHYGVTVVVGMILGTIFFGGLWITVQQMAASKRPGLLFMTSVVVRTAIVLAGFWYFAAGDAIAMISCLTGFVGVRLLATHGTAILGAAFGRRKSPQ